MSHKWSIAIHEYKLALKAAGRTDGTVRLHHHYLNQLMAVSRSPWKVSTQDLINLLAKDSWTQETKKSARGVYTGFYKWAYLKGYTEINPALLLPSVKVPQGKARPCPEAVLKRSINAADKRVRLMLKLGALCGLRAGEIATVNSSNLDENMLRVKGKGGKIRTVPVLDQELLYEIRTAGGWLFPGRKDGHLSPAYVSKLLSRNMFGAYTAHTLRHRYGTKAYAGTRDLLAVSELLGHSQPETTKRYIQMPPDAILLAAQAAMAA